MQEELLSKVKEFVRKVQEIEKDNLVSIVLFGSRARCDYTIESDFDIVVILRRCEERFIDRPLRYMSIVLELGLPVDLLVYTVDEFLNMLRDYNTFILDVIRDGKALFDVDFFTSLKRMYAHCQD